ncbi:MAG: FAD-dependent oxidoreductase, partial [Nitrospinaceae bacterium]|nr:NAD(P)/FAD-dependent oxidoreductase [Nitrospinaceae bacterium]NIR56024.1 NAD(P)/FAD-dependent oxidoreductase [Nitrospinaceae bacterium]NIS86468.1 NAD(P)/FAD-dependent oxidoreductase [Nitrospinaceae bacterium]NIT83303.1 NAD(P)/FAD-dependent oxidoreductase [Nitrospinaceae bacterium]NIU45513.1 NAD(P)/FAD-dependent oxidoreductase [Nitrospinaceae bacterium]
MKEFDVVVIGGGTAGISAARAALEKGATVGLVEMNRLGGFALYPGMILLQMLRDATQRGASLEPLNTLKAQAAEQSQHALKGIEESLQSENIEYIQGKGRLGEGGRIQISHDGETTEWHARKTVIATGSLSKPISTLPFDNHQIQPVEHLLETLELPSVPLVVGGDRAALETAYLLKSLGSKVFLVNDQTRLLSGQDPDLSGALEQSFKKQKIKLLLGNRIVSILKEDRGIQLTLEGGIKFSAENIFISAERLGRTQDLGLREANVELGSNSEIWVNE